MPFLRFKGIERDILKEISPLLVEEFSYTANVSKEKVKIELLNVERITDTPPSVEIFMFPRDQEVHDDLASIIHHLLKNRGYGNVHIFFVLLSPSLYYKEGRPLKESSTNILKNS
ncbi:DUF1904 family protein [Fictibacillus sp. Mic-4]|uniref:DUF1904 family protein n=1 Tax=Fictibacillus TaxID=1329200 RepID=UPI0003FE09C7|nr:DUF1904 family protein [Fictibacillus gelatini]